MTNLISNNPKPIPDLPKVNIDTLVDYPICYNDYKLPPNYVKYNEKSLEELDEEVEYDMDVEDIVWLKIINEQRSNDPHLENKEPIAQEDFEFLMDRLEKESYFQQASTSPQKNPNASPSLNSSRVHNDSTSDDALCCICLDGECINSNVILFCDMCNLAVHQECYGVPYIPEGQWLCRKCIQSPSAPVNCILCPNKYGAFKQTDRGEWAHVVCSIWIPEVHFANTVFLEPIIGTESIDRARWKLMCYICRKRNVGACIQCDKQNCYTAFHVTCAQQAGLYMNIQEEYIETRKKNNNNNNNRNNNKDANSSNSSLGEVRKCAYCDLHTPLEVLSPKTRKTVCKTGSYSNSSECKEALKQAQKIRMKKARKILAEQRRAPPVICLPVISKEKIEQIISQVEIAEKEKFIEKLVNYWLLKRYSRNGVPILRRLQNSAALKKNQEKIKLEENQSEKLELKEKLACWKKLRQDLEKARLLMELIRKRERLKREMIRIDQIKTLYEVNPFNGVFLQRVLDILIDFDKNMIFTQPVNPAEVPSYLETIKQPMDFSTMQRNLNELKYETFDQFEADFNLIINNCLTFNNKNDYFWKAAVKLKDQASSIIKQSKKICEGIGSENDFIIMLQDTSIFSNALKQLENIDKNPKPEIQKPQDKGKTPSTVGKRSKPTTSTPGQPTCTMSRRKLPLQKDEEIKQLNKVKEEHENKEEINKNRKSLRINKELALIEEDQISQVEPEPKTPIKRSRYQNPKKVQDEESENVDVEIEDEEVQIKPLKSVKKSVKKQPKKKLEKQDSKSEEQNKEDEKSSEQKTTPDTTGVNRRTSVLFRRNKSGSNIVKQNSSINSQVSNKKNDSISDTSSISDANNKDLMNVSSSTSQTCDSNNQ